MYNVSEFSFRKIGSNSKENIGFLTPIEENKDIPFEIKRVYYIYGVSGDAVRGGHSHKALHQVLICVSGSVDIKIKNYFGENTYHLDDPSKGLYIGPDNWREMSNFSEGSVLLVLASEKYDENDYTRDYDSFIQYIEGKYGNISSKKLIDRSNKK